MQLAIKDVNEVKFSKKTGTAEDDKSAVPRCKCFNFLKFQTKLLKLGLLSSKSLLNRSREDKLESWEICNGT